MIYEPGCEQQFTILSDFDIVIIRQEVRRRARLYGMNLRKQALLTAVISTIAREFLSIRCGLQVRLSEDSNGGEQWLDIQCSVPENHRCPRPVDLRRILDEVSMLVDDMIVGGEVGYPIIILRVFR